MLSLPVTNYLRCLFYYLEDEYNQIVFYKTLDFEIKIKKIYTVQIGFNIKRADARFE